MNRGYIKLWRRLRDNPLWLSEPFTRGQAWVDLLMLANHKKSLIDIRGILVEIEEGQVLAGGEFLGGRWKWSRKKVSNFLKYLETAQQIAQQKSNVCTVVTITNWKDHQEKSSKPPNKGTAEEQQKNSKSTTEAHTEECISTNKKKNRAFKQPTVKEVNDYVLAKGYNVNPEKFVAFYDSKAWMVGKNKMKNWKAAVTGWHTRNKGEHKVYERPVFNFPEGEEFSNE